MHGQTWTKRGTTYLKFMSKSRYCRAIYRWITVKNLNVMVFGNDLDKDTPMGLLRGIKYGTESYHVLFKRLCRYRDIQVVSDIVHLSVTPDFIAWSSRDTASPLATNLVSDSRTTGSGTRGTRSTLTARGGSFSATGAPDISCKHLDEAPILP